MKKIALVYNSKLSKFDFGPGHPFRGDRFSEFMLVFHKLSPNITNMFELVKPKQATDKELELVHTQEYINHVKSLEKHGGHLSIDTYVMESMVDAAKLIVGSGLTAAKLVMSGNYNLVITFGGFHHAGVASGEGFCVFNDVAITARMLIKKFRIKRIMIIDTDAHQGNGTMDIFYDDPKVLFLSMHQDPRTLYPGRGFINEIGTGNGQGFTVNVPMPVFSGEPEYQYVFEEIVSPLALEFRPEIIIRNGGSDPHYADELTQLGLSLDGLHLIGTSVRKLVNATSKKLIDMIVSGYGALTPYGWLAIIGGISGIDINYKAFELEPELKIGSGLDKDGIYSRTQIMVKELKNELQDYWSCLK